MAAIANIVPNVATSDTISVPAWWDGVPESFRRKPDYFRNVNMDNLILDIGAPKSDLSEISIALVDKTIKPNKKKERPYVKITGPPCRVAWPNLHATGDFPGVEGSALGTASFGLQIYEGDIPDDVVDPQPDENGRVKVAFPALEREQKAYFDFSETLYKKILELMYQEDRIRKKQKDDAMKLAMKYLPKDGPEREKALSEITVDVKQRFFDEANADDKKKYDFVRRDPDHYPGEGRYMLLKKSVSSRISDPEKLKHPESLRVPPTEDPDHYVNRLFADKKEYTPPYILLGDGKAVDLGYNEKQALFNKDIVIPSYYAKVTDSSKGYGSRPLYSVIQLVRAALPSEKKSGGTDHTDIADVYDPFGDDGDALSDSKKRSTPASKSKQSTPPKKSTKTGKPDDEDVQNPGSPEIKTEDNS